MNVLKMNVDLFQTQSVWILLVLISASVKMGFHDQPHQGHVKVVLTVLLIMKFKKLENLQITNKHKIFRVHKVYSNIWKRYQYLFSKKDLKQSHKLFSRI